MSRLPGPSLQYTSSPRASYASVPHHGAAAVNAAACGAASNPSTTSQHGPKQLSDTRYSSVSSSVLSLANDLRALGVDALLEVPALVIAGDQSSGKSSVVEAVAGVPLPRAEGTCTRCPTEVRMRRRAATNTSPWSCTVKLARGSGDAGGSGSAAAVAAGQPLEEQFCTVYDKAHISPAVTAAQAVLLNPSHVARQSGGATAFVPLCLGTAAHGSESGHRAPAPPFTTRAPGLTVAGNRAMGDCGTDEPSVSSAALTGHYRTSAGTAVRHSAAYDSLPSVRQYERQFTMDRVVLEIDGADADLTIVDLPGIIHNHADGAHHVKAVHAMVQKQLEPQHHIIVMTLPAMLDQETQVIRRWAHEVDPDGQRTIGVITKPDMIPDGQTSMHRKLIDLVSLSTGTQHHGHHHPHTRASAASGSSLCNPDSLRLGCYVVKNPPQEEIEAGTTFDEARQSERDYFTSSPHWAPAMATPSQLASRLGVDNLREGLSTLLVQQIQQQLPDMRKRLQRRLAEVGQQLGDLPPPPSTDPLRELRLLLRQAAARLDQELNGAHGHSKACVQQLRGMYDEFGFKVVRSTPAFLVGGKLVGALSPEDKGLREAAGASAAAAAAAAAATASDNKQPGDAAGAAVAGELLQLLKMEANGDVDLRPVFDRYAKMTAAAAGGGGSAVYGGVSKAAPYDCHDVLCIPEVAEMLDGWGFAVDDLWTLGRVQQQLDEHRGCELPTFPPYDAFEDLVRAFKGRWGSHAAECVDDVAAAVQRRAAAVAAELFGRFPRAHNAVGAELAEYVDSLVQKVQGEVAQMVKIEDSDVFVMGADLFRDLEAAFRSRLKKAYLKREDVPAAAGPAVGEANDEREKLRRQEAERRDKKLEEALRLLKDYGDVSFASFEEVFMAKRTPVDDELHVMAACLAYFKSAFQRFQAAVPMRIRDRLLKRVVDPDGVEAIVGRLVHRARGGQAAAESEGQPPGSGQGSGTHADCFEELEQQWAVARELLSEGEALATQRRTLTDMRERLKGAAERLASVAF